MNSKARHTGRISFRIFLIVLLFLQESGTGPQDHFGKQQHTIFREIARDWQKAPCENSQQNRPVREVELAGPAPHRRRTRRGSPPPTTPSGRFRGTTLDPRPPRVVSEVTPWRNIAPRADQQLRPMPARHVVTGTGFSAVPAGWGVPPWPRSHGGRTWCSPPRKYGCRPPGSGRSWRRPPCRVGHGARAMWRGRAARSSTPPHLRASAGAGPAAAPAPGAGLVVIIEHSMYPAVPRSHPGRWQYRSPVCSLSRSPMARASARRPTSMSRPAKTWKCQVGHGLLSRPRRCWRPPGSRPRRTPIPGKSFAMTAEDGWPTKGALLCDGGDDWMCLLGTPGSGWGPGGRCRRRRSRSSS